MKPGIRKAIVSRMKSRYPIKVLIFRKQQNAIIIDQDRAEIVKKALKTDTGQIMREKYLDILNEDMQLPDPSPRFYIKHKGYNWLYYIQLDRDEWQPLSSSEKGLFYDLPIYKLNEDGTVAYDEKTRKPIIERYQQTELFNAKYIMKDGKVEDIPSIVGVKTHDPEQWRQRRNDIAERLYAPLSVYQKYKDAILIVLTGVVVAILMSVALTKYSEISKQNFEYQKQISESNQALAKTLNENSGNLARLVDSIRIMMSNQNNPSRQVTSAPPPA